MPRITHEQVLQGPVGPTIFRMAAPMAYGIAAILLFTLVDTFWIGQLGANQLAAMGFSFPVTMFVSSFAMGISVGVTAVVGRIIGSGDSSQSQRLSTDALLLGLLVVAVVSPTGLMVLDSLFRALGADSLTLPYIHDYMTVWFAGVGFLVFPMIANGVIRATGDTKSPAIIMIAAGIVNVVLDPFLIFGIGPFPRLGLQGAAISSVLSWVAATLAAVWVLAIRDKLVTLRPVALSLITASWRRILFIGLPAAVTQLLVPVGTGVVTRIVSAAGPEAVAGYGVANRIESFALIGMMALSAATVPFTAQNHGARNVDRLHEGFAYCTRTAMVYGVIVAVALAFGAPFIGAVFSDDAAVQDATRIYLWLVPISYGAFGTNLLSNSMLNGITKPYLSTLLMALRVFLFTLPFSWLASRLGGINEIFGAVSLSYMAGGGVAYWVMRGQLRTLRANPGN